MPRLPFAEAEFDAVISTFGAMFALQTETVASELGRVVRPGGRVVLTTWKPDSNVFGPATKNAGSAFLG